MLRIAKYINKTYVSWMKEHVILDWMANNPLAARQPSQYSPFRQNQLSCLTSGFYDLQSKISGKINLKPLEHTLSFWIGFVNVFCNFINNSLNACVVELHSIWNFFKQNLTLNYVMQLIYIGYCETSEGTWHSQRPLCIYEIKFLRK